MSRNEPATPKWLGARAVLLHRIEAGELSPGERLPAEPVLAMSLGVSRATLREALRSLEDDGYLSRKPGAGTHVATGSRFTNSLNNNLGVADIIRSMGMVPGTRSMEIHFVDASEEVARDLGIEVGVQLVVVERVRTADDVAMVFSTSFYPAGPGRSQPLTLEDIGEESLYQVLERLAGIKVQHGTGTIAPARADAALAAKLSVPKGTLLMHLRQVDHDERGVPVMLSSEYYLSEAFVFTVLRRGPRSTTIPAS